MHPVAVLAARGGRIVLKVSILTLALLREVRIFGSFVEASIKMRWHVRMLALGLAPLGALHDALQQPRHLVVLPVPDEEVVVGIIRHARRRARVREGRERQDGPPWMDWRRYAGL